MDITQFIFFAVGCVLLLVFCRCFLYLVCLYCLFFVFCFSIRPKQKNLLSGPFPCVCLYRTTRNIISKQFLLNRRWLPTPKKKISLFVFGTIVQVICIITSPFHIRQPRARILPQNVSANRNISRSNFIRVIVCWCLTVCLQWSFHGTLVHILCCLFKIPFSPLNVLTEEEKHTRRRSSRLNQIFQCECLRLLLVYLIFKFRHTQNCRSFSSCHRFQTCLGSNIDVS